MLYLYAIIFVQTVLESLPISSSGHVLLFNMICDAHGSHYCVRPQLASPIFEAWFYCLHGLTAVVLAIYFFPQWFFFIKHIARLWRLILRLIFLVLCTDIITFVAFLGVHYFGFSFPLQIGLCLTALSLASLSFVPQRSYSRSFNIRDAFILGVVQGFALLPGISRFASTFVAARWLGYSNKRAFELTWMIQWPLLLAASILFGFYQLYEYQMLGTFFSGSFVFAYILAGIGAYAALYAVQLCIQHNKMHWFAYYMILPILLAFCL